MPRIPTLLAKLSHYLGSRQQALREFRWIKESIGSRPDASQALLADKLLKRTQGWPLQYLLGTQPFGSIEILTRPPTLIPRPETEYWTLRLAQNLQGYASKDVPLRMLDLCTGTACIPLLLCDSLPPRTISALGIDVSPEAVKLANENISHCGSNNSSGNTVRVECLDIFAQDFAHSLKQRVKDWEPFDVLTSNPPYIPRQEYNKLSHTVRSFEDPLALLGEVPSSADELPCQVEYDKLGLSFYAHIASLLQNQNLVRPGGHVALEVGQGQARAVEKMLLTFASQTHVWSDPWGIERVVYARM
ncbi:S-adenosyl-L-methionine-dependent methyltransferase [Rhizoctonia solani AG-3 Rhs1AP]|uniref:S-adenosyl-L-methionine-dependent methyltransferase n=1 Tax=Rhizoctonia solani AG-3 Rhs1AP TaxID=1086054 RepID=X8JK38_9AGAM|nr:S-adenosyl-L-methionine-dependent methyltransferase [Rhizoctonia solani AG-3 Rhs1AP]